uniref:Lipin N-terminal domain-containing protein n=1 Tax=Mucochytrium quahogii TaxID=96639 RepID=A0A7S2SR66_9STRA|mmetsp:Transcript_442/g.788  ORF Transcript_442/g.788 Transcript_442/m.788 type:complete len:301 (-) Transcript_442:30-932(-)
MNVIKLIRSYFYNNTYAGADDVVVIKDADGRMICSPFFVNFPVHSVEATACDPTVDMRINGETIDFEGVKVDRITGRCYFVQSDFTQAFRIPDELLHKLKLLNGRNQVSFQLKNTVLKLMIYFCDPSQKIVVINASQGLFDRAKLPALFRKVARNGYLFLYISTQNNINQVEATRATIRERDFPEGPVIFTPCAPTPVAPQESFIVKTLRGFQGSQGSIYGNRLYAGVGEVQHKRLFVLSGIPAGKYFAVEEEEIEGSFSISDMCDVVEFCFPPNPVSHEAFNSHNFWRIPILKNETKIK